MAACVWGRDHRITYSRAVDYRPPSQHKADPDLETLHDKVTPWMIEPLVRWFEPFLVARDDLGESSPILDFIEALEMNLQLPTPIDRHDPGADLRARMSADPRFGIMAISYVLSTISVIRTDDQTVTNTQVVALDKLLRDSGSVWEVTELGVQDGVEGEKQLTLARRDLVVAKLAVSDVRAQGPRAGAFLADAWNAIATIEPQPSEAYDKAVKAVEVAAQPVVLPNNPNARLGQIIAAMKDKPSDEK